MKRGEQNFKVIHIPWMLCTQFNIDKMLKGSTLKVLSQIIYYIYQGKLFVWVCPMTEFDGFYGFFLILYIQ